MALSFWQSYLSSLFPISGWVSWRYNYSPHRTAMDIKTGPGPDTKEASSNDTVMRRVVMWIERMMMMKRRRERTLKLMTMIIVVSFTMKWMSMAESTCLRNMYRINHPAGFRWKIALFLIGGLLVSNNASILTFLFFCIHWPEELWFLPLGSSSPHSVKSPCVCAKSLQLYPTLCDPMDHSPPGSSVHRILQSPYPSQFFTCAPAQPVKLVQNNGQHKTHPSNIQLGFTYVQSTFHSVLKVSLVSQSVPCPVWLSATPWTVACQATLSIHGIFWALENIGVCYHALLQGIFPTQGWNLHLLSLLNWQAGSLPLVPPGEEKNDKPTRWREPCNDLMISGSDCHLARGYYLQKQAE